jgi:hypothetical protein
VADAVDGSASLISPLAMANSRWRTLWRFFTLARPAAIERLLHEGDFERALVVADAAIAQGASGNATENTSTRRSVDALAMHERTCEGTELPRPHL